MSEVPAVLTIHALDSRAEEGVIADAAVIAELGCTPACVATGLLSSTPDGSRAFEPLPFALIERQLAEALAGGAPAAIRVGLAGAAEVVARVAGCLASASDSAVVAPGAHVSEGRVWSASLLAAHEGGLWAFARVLVLRAGDLPAFGLGTPSGLDDLRRCATALRERGARAVLLSGLIARERVLDLLDDGGTIAVFDAARIQSARRPGVADAHAVALAAHLARGASLATAAERAQRYVGLRLRRAR